MSSVSMALVQRNKNALVDEINAWQRTGRDLVQPQKFAKMNTVYAGLARVERNVLNNTNLSLHGLGTVIKTIPGGYGGGETKQQRADRLRAERQAKRAQQAQIAYERKLSAQEKKQAALDRQYDRKQAALDKKYAHTLAVETLRHPAAATAVTPYGYDQYGNPLQPYNMGYGLAPQPSYDVYAQPQYAPYGYQDYASPYGDATPQITNVYQQAPGNTAYDDGSGDYDEYSLPGGQLPQMSIPDSIYADIDSGGAYDALSGGFGELSPPKQNFTPVRVRPNFQTQVAQGGTTMVLVGLAALAVIYSASHKKGR